MIREVGAVHLRKTMVLTSLRALPPEQQRATAAALFDLARQFADLNLRRRALFDAGDFAVDEVQKRTAFLAGIAAAEQVPDLDRRTPRREHDPQLPRPRHPSVVRADAELQCPVEVCERPAAVHLPGTFDIRGHSVGRLRAERRRLGPRWWTPFVSS
jgi:hypothetical protein